MDERDQLLTVPQAAALLGMHRAAAFRAVQAGRLPAIRVGGVWVLRRTDVEVYRAAPKHAGGRPKQERGGA